MIRIKLPKLIGKHYWMRKLKLGFKVQMSFKPNHPEEIYYILTR